MRKRGGLVVSISVVALALAAAPASATSIQNGTTGQPYTGPLNGINGSDVVTTSPSGTVTCNESTFGGQITNSAGGPMAGSLTSLTFTHSGMAACSTALPHDGSTAQNFPWPIEINWLSDNTSGTPNATFTISNFQVVASFAGGSVICTLVGNGNGTAGTTKQVIGDLFNPDNAGGDTQLKWVNEPLSVSGSGCPSTANVSAIYIVTGQDSASLQVRQNPPASNPPGGGTPSNPTNPTPSAGGTAGQTGGKKKCKRTKGKGAAAAKRKKGCRKKRR